MSALLDLDDVVAGNPAAQRELAALRDQVAALTAERDGAVYVSQKMLEQNTYLVEQSNAPVPAQPAVVPEAVASIPVTPDVETLKRMHVAYWGSATSNYWHENSEPLWRKTYSALLSAADTEVKK